MLAVEAEHGARLALGGGHAAPEQGGEFGEDLGQTEAGLGIGPLVAVPAIEQLLQLAGTALGGLRCDRRKWLLGEGRERDLAPVGGDEHGQRRVEGVVGEAVALSGERRGHA